MKAIFILFYMTQILDSDKNRLTTEKELLTTRLNALSDILSIQEKQISQVFIS